MMLFYTQVRGYKLRQMKTEHVESFFSLCSFLQVALVVLVVWVALVVLVA